MKRRNFILGLGGATLCAGAARGQQPPPTVGVLVDGTEQAARSSFAPIKARLAVLGYLEGRNFAVEYRWGDFRQERLPDLARELDERRVAAIVTLGGPATVAAKSITTSTPILFYTGFDPIVSGYVRSLNHPGGNVTGVYILNSQLIYKRIEILHELVPEAKKIAFFWTDTGDPKTKVYADQIIKAAEGIGIEMLTGFSASRVDEIEGLFTRAENENAGAVLVNQHGVYFANGGKLVTDLAARYRIPAMYPLRLFAAAGGLVSYGQDDSETYRHLGDLVRRVLNGEKPEDLPVQQVTKFELVFNAKTAKSLDLQIPMHLLGLAEIIE